MFKCKLTDGLHQMSLAETNAAVYKERIVCFTGSFGYSQRGGMGETVTFSDNKRFKSVFWIQLKGLWQGSIYRRYLLGFTLLVIMGDKL